MDGPLKHLPAEHFDLVIIDECSQAIEAACWIPLSLASKCILAGDHMQLPPTVCSKKAAKDGLGMSLMERLVKMIPKKMKCVILLERQYRMHRHIMLWPSSKLYGNKLIADETVEKHLLKDLPAVEINDITSLPLLFIDTAGCDFRELDLEEEDSKGNEAEANLVAVHVESLIKSGISCEDIAVSTPYNLQVELIRCRLLQKHPTLEIKSVDGFQGREKEAVVLSLVRSNEKGQIGFLADNRRINVAITRAKRQLVVIGDSETVSHDPFLKSLVDYVNDYGEVWPANQFSQEIENVECIPSENISLKYKSSKPTVKSNPQQPTRNGKSAKITVIGPARINQKDDKTEKEKNDSQKRIYFEKLITEFKSNKEKDSYRFPSTLSSFDRMVIHEIADKYKIYHISEGEGNDRHITLFKNQIIVSLKTLKLKDQAESAAPNSCNLSINEHLGRSTWPIAPVFDQEPPTESRKSDTKTEVKKKEPPKNKPTKKNKDPDSDTILDMAIAMKDTCKCKGCKESVKLFGQICEFCKEKYCLAHCIPETHGCTQDVRAHARRTATQEFKRAMQNGQEKKIKTIDPVKRIHLQRKLDKRLSELTNQRKGKK